MVLARSSGGEGKGICCLKGIVSVWEDKKTVLEMDGGGSHTVMCVYLIPQNYTFKMVKIVNFKLCVLKTKPLL